MHNESIIVEPQVVIHQYIQRGLVITMTIAVDSVPLAMGTLTVLPVFHGRHTVLLKTAQDPPMHDVLVERLGVVEKQGS